MEHSTEPAPQAADVSDRKAAVGGARGAGAPELVVAVVSALGTELDAVMDDFDIALRAVGYRTNLVRVSELIHQIHREAFGEVQPKSSMAELLMSQGDQLRRDTRRNGAACALAIAQIRRTRELETGSPTEERHGVVTMIRSVKHPDEVALLRRVYGGRLLVAGVSASPADREHALVRRLRNDRPGQLTDWYVAEAARLLTRDQKDEGKPYGQRVRDAFAQADVYLWIRSGRSLTQQVRRIVELWFGKPFETPTRDEQGMYYAHAAQFRSAAAGRQVGAAVVDDDGEVLVTGTNEVPRPGGGQYWSGDSPDFRDFVAGYEANDRQKYVVAQDLLQRLADHQWLAPAIAAETVEGVTERALSDGGPLRGSRVDELIEFGRIAHAEMAAICTAARRGTAIGGATLYTTTYPCHECARLIVASGVDRVVYIDPYPKSQVPELYRGQVSEAGGSARADGVLPFVPFEGVAPRLFADVFRMGARSRDVRGVFASWKPAPRLSDRIGSSIVTTEMAAVEELLRSLAAAQWRRAAPAEQ